MVLFRKEKSDINDREFQEMYEEVYKALSNISQKWNYKKDFAEALNSAIEESLENL